MKFNNTFPILFALFFALAGCQTVKHVKCNEVDPVNNLAWLKQKIAEIEKHGAENKDVEIYRYMYLNRPVFYISGRCCDVPNELYDCEGNKICEPDGGITGIGDGKCVDFQEKREDETYLWPPRDKKM